MNYDERGRVRSYRYVLDKVERRIYRVDRWRLPWRGGITVRALLYAITCAVAMIVAARLPIVGLPVAAIPASLRLALALAGGVGLAAFEPDGRAAHHALWALTRYLASPRTRSGLRASAG